VVDVGWEGRVQVEGDVEWTNVGAGREVEHGFDCEFRSREQIPSGGEGQCEDGREAVSDGVVSAYFTDAFALEDVIPVVCVIAVWKALSQVNAKEIGTNDWVIMSLDYPKKKRRKEVRSLEDISKKSFGGI
jgi:hypothetical protein